MFRTAANTYGTLFVQKFLPFYRLFHFSHFLSSNNTVSNIMGCCSSGGEINPFPHMTNQQQTTFTISRQKHKQISINEGLISEKKLKTLWQNEIAGFEQFLLLSQ